MIRKTTLIFFNVHMHAIYWPHSLSSIWSLSVCKYGGLGDLVLCTGIDGG